MTIKETCKAAKDNAFAIEKTTENQKDIMLTAISESLKQNLDYILKENIKDILIAQNDKPAHFIDRLKLTKERIDGICEGINKLLEIPSPVGETLEKFTAHSGLEIEKVRVPLGVLGVIYEARPNVTVDVICLAVKSGNAIVLRGSKDAINSNAAIVSVIKEGLKNKGFNPEFIQLITDVSREGVNKFLKMNKFIDVIIPRGSAALIENTVKNSIIPVIETGSGNCHLYVEKSADFDMALNILLNGKLSRPSVCNALESLLIDKAIAEKFLPIAAEALNKNKVEMRGCEKCVKISKLIKKAENADYFTEYNALIISIKIVNNYKEAVKHINKYNTKHSDAIITSDNAAAEYFLNNVDAATVYVNASTRFTDGFEFGFGAEVGISTQKLHARGPMGLKELTSYKYKIRGNGQIRG